LDESFKRKVFCSKILQLHRPHHTATAAHLGFTHHLGHTEAALRLVVLGEAVRAKKRHIQGPKLGADISTYILALPILPTHPTFWVTTMVEMRLFMLKRSF
jgi:hypothetical protein